MKRAHDKHRFLKWIGLFMVCAVLVAVLQSLPTDKPSSDPFESSVAIINDIAVPPAEYQMVYQRNIAVTYNHFFQQYGASAHADFWQSSHDGQTPSEWIRKRTLQQLVHLKVIQTLAIDLNIVEPFDYTTMQTWWKEHNESRKEKHKSGGVVYGPVEDSFEDFYSYFFSTLEIKVKDKLNATRLRATDAELQSFYQRQKSELFAYTPYIKVEYLEIPDQHPSQQTELETRVHKAQHKAVNGSALKSLTELFEHADYAVATYSDSTHIIGEDNPEHARRTLALQLSAGEVDVFRSHDNSAFYIMKCLERAKKRMYTYEAVRSDVIWHYQNERYETLIDSLEQGAIVRVNETMLKAITGHDEPI